MQRTRQTFSMVLAAILFGIRVYAAANEPGGEGLSKREMAWTKGKFEDFSLRRLWPFRGQLTLIPEYERNTGPAIVSWELVKLGYGDHVQALLESGASKVLLRIPSGKEKKIRRHAAVAALVQALGRDSRRLEFLEHSPYPKSSNHLDVEKIWARDWGPVAAETSAGKLCLIDFIYRRGCGRRDSLSTQSISKHTGIMRVGLPVSAEPGALTFNGRGLGLLSEAFYAREISAEMDGIERAQGKSAERNMASLPQVVKKRMNSLLIQFLGMRQIEVFPPTPMILHGHIDIWAKFADDETVLVGELSLATIDAAFRAQWKHNLTGFPDDFRDKALVFRAFLESNAKRIKKLGLKAVRVPMPCPFDDGGGIRSAINSAFVGKVAIVPQYEPLREFGETRKSMARLEARVVEAYRQAGYKVKFVTGYHDPWGGFSGATHCLTSQIPRPICSRPRN